MLNGNDIVIHKKKRDLRKRLTDVLRSLANLQKRSRIAQVFYDLSCCVDLTGPIDQSRLPTIPDGFVVRQATILKYRNQELDTLCLYQVASMAVLYYWMYAAMHDPQDTRSCERYLEWIEEYAKVPKAYSVEGGVRDGYYLYPLGGQPHIPEWLTEGEGETV